MTAAAFTNSPEQRIGEGEFSSLAIYRRAGAKGPVYRIVFDNLEYGGARAFALRFAYMAMMTLLFPLIIAAAMAMEAVGAHWMIGIAGYPPLTLLVHHFAYHPRRVARAIEIDTGDDRLRVFKGNRVEIERPHSAMKTLSVEPHSDAEYAARARQERGNPVLKDAEKTHCLIGWFGPGGGQQVILLCRAEWPNRNSLLEVRQAILWALQQSEEAEEPAQTRRAPLNPPLD